ncbi:uncharacterized protein [Diadema antillarum]|uniref:uncharacterized protein n=1 Tax=Diadema antillarum TaxID=105358 RepID=UPI003A89BEDB
MATNTTDFEVWLSNVTVSNDNPPSSPRCKWPAPHPVWPDAFATWGALWTVHVVTFTIAFASLATFSCGMLSMLVWRRCKSGERGEQVTSQRLSSLRIALHSLVFVATGARTMSIGIDPYGTRKILVCPSGVILWSLGWPSLVSSFSILLLLLLETTRLSLAPPRIQRPSVLCAIISVSLGYVIFSDFLVAYNNSAKYAITVCQLLFILWGILLFVGFMMVWWKIKSNLMASSSGQTTTSDQRNSGDDSKMRRLNTIIFTSAAIGACLTTGNLYWTSSILDKSFRPSALRPWPWLAFNTCQRFLEVSISAMILVTVSKSSKTNKVEAADRSVGMTTNQVGTA